MRVDRWMTRDVKTVTEDTPAAEAYRIFHEYEIRHLPVLRAGKLVGIVSDHDIGREVLKGPRGLEQTVRALMSTIVVTTAPESSVLEAALEMHNRRFGCLPVVDGEGHLVGILSRNDLLEVLVSQLQESGE